MRRGSRYHPSCFPLNEKHLLVVCFVVTTEHSTDNRIPALRETSIWPLAVSESGIVQARTGSAPANALSSSRPKKACTGK